MSFKNVTFNGDSYPDGVLKPGSGTLELLEESVGRSITVRYSCGVLETRLKPVGMKAVQKMENMFRL